MNVLNKEGNEFSEEYLMMMAVAGYCIYGAQMIIYKCARQCDLKGLAGSFFQKKKQYINAAANNFTQLKTNLEAGFDEHFERMNHGRMDYANFIQQYGCDLMKLIFLYVSRTENHPERRADIFKAIEAMPVDDTADYRAIIDYFTKEF